MADLFCLVGPLLRSFDPEVAHGLSLKALKSGLAPKAGFAVPASLKSRVWGLEFANPVGLAAGYDKDAEVVDPLLDQGFGFVEVGSITPKPQPGNPKPRLFRLPEDGAVINRMGFNSKGVDQAAARLAARPRRGIVGVNLGKNKETVDAAADFAIGAAKLSPFADYLVVNVSSPNTPGLRALQGPEPLAELLRAVVKARNQACAEGVRPPLLLKIAPDLTDQDQDDIAAVVLAEGVDGLICTNTTIARPETLKGAAKAETGGLSGAPLMEPSTKILGQMYRRTQGRLPIIGVGGIASADDAYRKICAGASLVQVYSALVYQGPGLVRQILDGLAKRLQQDGHASLSEAVGADHRR